MTAPRSLVLFNYDWDHQGFARWASEFPSDSAGFDLFSFPSNAHLVNFDLQGFVDDAGREYTLDELKAREGLTLQ